MSEEQKRPKVGTSVAIFKDGKILLARRKSDLEKGKHAWPGGHMEYMESFEDCVRREVREEAGLEIKNIKFLRIANLKIGDKHFVDVTFTADWASGEPKQMEPDKSEEWQWYDLDHLPAVLFQGEDSSLDAMKTGRNFYDA